VSKNHSKVAVELALVVAEILSLSNTAIAEVTMFDDAEHLAMTKTRMTKMTTDVHTQTHHHYSVIQIQSNRLEAAHL